MKQNILKWKYDTWYTHRLALVFCRNCQQPEIKFWIRISWYMSLVLFSVCSIFWGHVHIINPFKLKSLDWWEGLHQQGIVYRFKIRDFKGYHLFQNTKNKKVCLNCAYLIFFDTKVPNVSLFDVVFVHLKILLSTRIYFSCLYPVLDSCIQEFLFKKRGTFTYVFLQKIPII